MEEFLSNLFNIVGILFALVLTLLMFGAFFEMIAEKITETKYNSQNKVHQKDDEIKDLKAKLAACEKVHQAEIAEKDKQIEKRDNWIKELEEKIQKLRSGEIPPLERERYQSKIGNLESLFSNERNKKITLENDLRNANAKIEELCKNTVPFNAPTPANLDTEDLKAQLDKAQSDILSYQDTITALREERNLNESLKQKDNIIKTLTFNYNKQIEITNTLSADLSKAQEELEALKKEKKALRALYLEGVRQMQQFFSQKAYSIDLLLKRIKDGKLNYAFGTDVQIAEIAIVAMLTSKQNRNANSYLVTLEECECEDFQRTKKPCKHMVYLAYELAILQTCRISDQRSPFSLEMESLAAPTSKDPKVAKKAKDVLEQKIKEHQKH